MDKRGDISLQVLVIAGTSARRSHLVGLTSRALNGVNVISDPNFICEICRGQTDILVADLDTPAGAARCLISLRTLPLEPVRGSDRRPRSSLGAVCASSVHSCRHLA